MADPQHSHVLSSDPGRPFGRDRCCAKGPDIPIVPRHERSPRFEARGAKPFISRRSMWNLLIVIKDGIRARNSVAVIVAVVVLLVVATVIANWWTGMVDSDISRAGWVAMGFGAIFTIVLGVGLMSLVFISNRRGYDEPSRTDD